MIHVPAAVQRTRPAPLVLFFHGALRTVDAFVDSHQPLAEELGVIILAPYATEGTWDAIGGDFGRDVDVVDRALRWTFDRWAVDPGRVGLSGFSDGGTYALALGRANGDLFGRVAAYSPGFLLPVTPVGRPSILISHGTDDAVLPINRTSRRIVPELERQGYTVDYREFAGPHVLSRSAMEAFVRGVVG
ncbi:MAG TPA: hypothetical protein VD793_04915 [Gemmatimonadales bacterium]|nr:hypothetical protein [Gemmatimonadales bacterium]